MSWLDQVRGLCARYGRAKIADQCIGQLLSRAPADVTGVWPCLPVCEALEQIGSPDIGTGFMLGVHNGRGVHVRREGGGQERELAAKYRGWSEQLGFDYPYVSGILERIATSYDSEAEWQDSESNVSKRLNH